MELNPVYHCLNLQEFHKKVNDMTESNPLIFLCIVGTVFQLGSCYCIEQTLENQI